MSITSQTPRNIHFDSKSTPSSVGPGAYEQRSCFTPSKKTRIPFGTTTRRDLWNIPDGQEYVGPGRYELESKNRPISCLTNIRLESKRQYFIDTQQNPSPADYSSIEQWGKNRPKTNLTNRPKRIRAETPPPKAKEEIPGPSSYNLMNNEIDIDHAFAFSASKSPQREPAKYNGIPGPAYYGETSDRRKNQNSQSPAFKSKDKRNIFNNPVNDGVMPNHFAWMPEIFEGRPFGSNTHRELDWKAPGKESPGPAAYASNSKRELAKKQTLAFGTDRVFYQNEMNGNPGPGYYDKCEQERQKSGSKLPSFNRAKRADIWDVKITPAPGQYEENVAEKIERAALLRIQSPAFKDRSEKGDSYVGKETGPGPALYYSKLPPKKHYSKFNREVRFRDDNFVGPFKMNDSPSPANYTVETKETRKKIPGGQKVTAKRFMEDSKDNKNVTVGPGKYGKLECGLIHPSYNIKFDPELKKKSELKKLYS